MLNWPGIEGLLAELEAQLHANDARAAAWTACVGTEGIFMGVVLRGSLDLDGDGHVQVSLDAMCCK